MFVEGKLFYKAGEGSGGGGGDEHNLGWYATSTALTTAHPTASAGDWAIVGSTDTVWIWDTDNSEWVDSDQKGQVTSVNGQTGAVTVSEVPSQTGNAGKFLTTDGTDASWSNSVSELNISSTNLYHLKIEKITALSFGLSFYTYDNVTGQLYYNVNNHQWVLKGPYSNYFIFDEIYTCLRTSSAGGTLGNSSVKWDSIYVTKINNGSDITVPNVTGELAVKQVNSTITLAAADWSSNTQTVNVTGITADGVVLVSPDPTDQSAYTSAGVLCTAQAAGTLTFTCDTVPSADIDVNVVML